MKKLIVLIGSHLAAVLAGFAAGIYLLPILISPEAPSVSTVRAMASNARFSGKFVRDLQDSDALHWGEGTVFVGRDAISLEGSISPGPDYKLYLSPAFLETEADFLRLKPSMVRVGDIKTFENFVVVVPESIDPGEFTSVIVWCETFGQFISAAKYR